MRMLSKININNANLEEEFFPFFHVENCFDKELDSSELLRDFPPLMQVEVFQLKNSVKVH